MKMSATLPRAALAAITLSVAVVSLAHAQSGADPLGMSNATPWLVVLLRMAGAVGILWGVVRWFGGHHAEGVITMGIGAVVVGKAESILSFLGIR